MAQRPIKKPKGVPSKKKVVRPTKPKVVASASKLKASTAKPKQSVTASKLKVASTSKLKASTASQKPRSTASISSFKSIRSGAKLGSSKATLSTKKSAVPVIRSAKSLPKLAPPHGSSKKKTASKTTKKTLAQKNRK